MRMHSLPALAAVFLAAAGMAGGVVAEEVGIAGHGLIGYGITMYQVSCYVQHYGISWTNSSTSPYVRTRVV